MRKLLPLLVALAACERREVLPYGPTELTPAGYPVVLPTTYRLPTMNRDEAMRLVDYRVAQWIREKDSWGLSGYSDAMLGAAARGVPIVVFDSDVTPYFGTSGANILGEWIEVAIYVAEGGENMAALPHELTHSILLHFHGR